MSSPDNGDLQIGRFTSGELKFASWWVRNHLALRRFGYVSLVSFSVIVWGYALWGLLDAYAISYPRESRITRDIAINQQLLNALEKDRPQDVSLSDVSVAQTTDNRYDMSVEVTNTNEEWWVEFSYRFSLSGEETPSRHGYVLPQGKQNLTELGFRPSARGGRNASLIVDNVRWHRLDRNLVGASYPEYLAKRLALSFTDITYDTNITLGTKSVGQTSFVLVNNSAYGYWAVDVVVRLYRGGAPIATNKITLTRIAPGERRPVQMVWLENIPGVTKTEIIPQVNVLDPSVFLSTNFF